MASVQARIADALIRRARPFGGGVADVPAMRRRFGRLTAVVPPHPGVAVRTISAGGVPADLVVPRGAPRDRCLLYVHGGAWCIGSPRTHRGLAGDLTARAGVRGIVIDYRLAPEHPFPAGLDDCVTAYRWLLARRVDPGRIVVVGDSAGGNLAAALLVRLRDEGVPLPGGAVLLSPATDLTMTGASLVTNRACDPFFSDVEMEPFVDAYLAGHDPADPYASPLGADLRGLPPLLVHVGDHEVLEADAVRFAERAAAVGVDARLVVWPGMMHVFQTFSPFLPEAIEAHEAIAAFSRERIVP